MAPKVMTCLMLFWFILTAAAPQVITFEKLSKNQIQFQPLSDQLKKDHCSLVHFSSSHVKGYDGAVVYVDSSFVDSIHVIKNVALSCNTLVWVTSSFRHANTTPSGAIVPPSVHSNHLVGHAIDFNLQTSSGWCNSTCLRELNNEEARCFVNRVKERGLRWGGDFIPCDSVHIDDDLYLTNPNKWMKLYHQLQKVC